MGVPSYVLNFDELADLIKDYLQNGIDVDIGSISFSTTDIERLLSEISNKIQGINYDDLINALNNLGAKLEGLTGDLGLTGTQKIYGEMIESYFYDIDHQNNIIEFTVPSKGKITGVTYSCTSWDYRDSWDLTVDGVTLFSKARTKEYGEHKYFTVFYPVESGQKIKFIYNNVSESSRVIWVDFNILEA